MPKPKNNQIFNLVSLCFTKSNYVIIVVPYWLYVDYNYVTISFIFQIKEKKIIYVYYTYVYYLSLCLVYKWNINKNELTIL